MKTFKDRLKALCCASYREYLNSTHWNLFKKRYKESGRPRICAVCDSFEYELHHCTYERLGSERLDDVVPLCSVHHKGVHEWLGINGLHVEGTHQAVKSLRGCEPIHATNPTQEPKGRLTKRQRKILKRQKEFAAAPKLLPITQTREQAVAHESAKETAKKALDDYRRKALGLTRETKPKPIRRHGRKKR